MGLFGKLRQIKISVKRKRVKNLGKSTVKAVKRKGLKKGLRTVKNAVKRDKGMYMKKRDAEAEVRKRRKAGEKAFLSTDARGFYFASTKP